MLNLRDIETFPAHLSMTEDASRLSEGIEGLALSGTVQVELHILRSDNIYYCSGVTRCEATLDCSRCLEPFGVSLSGDVEFSIQEAPPGSKISPDEVPDDEIIVDTGASEIDISDAIRESLVLEIPLKPLCTAECRGICPQCGCNRNEHDCDCTVETKDSRWDGLRDLLPKDSKTDR